jgi:hypothetical protein
MSNEGVRQAPEDPDESKRLEKEKQKEDVREKQASEDKTETKDWEKEKQKDE